MNGWIVGHDVQVIVGIVGANNHLPLRIIAIDQIDDDFHDGVFFLGFALGNQQCKRNQGIIGDTLFSVCIKQIIMTCQKPDKQRGGNAFVAIGKGMILDDKIQQIGRFLFNTGVKLLAAEGLVNRAYSENITN
jgi:hypothetical protein